MNRRPSAPPGEPAQKTNLITPGGYKRLSDELDNLFQVERPKLVDEVHQAALQGDRSENAEYIYGKKRLREIDKRIGFLQRRLDIARVIDPARQSGDKVRFGAYVTIADEDGKSRVWQIVGEDEADPSAGRISWKSPLGRSLMEKSVGDLATVHSPAGEREVEIIDLCWK